jgi:hypothetical protein
LHHSNSQKLCLNTHFRIFRGSSSEKPMNKDNVHHRASAASH